MRLLSSATGVELTADRLFEHRVRRLVGTSAVALGVIWGLAFAADAPAWVLVLLAIGWVSMPTVLASSLRRPLVRYALVVPATAVSVGLIGMTVAAPGSTAFGWFVLTFGILFGGSLGAWLWFRWLPVPRLFDDPFAAPRMTLIAVHIGLVLVGVSAVAAGL